MSTFDISNNLLSAFVPSRRVSNNTTINDEKCYITSPLETTFASDTMGFGSMFTVQSKATHVKILTLAFSAFEPTGGTVDVQVYTKLGDYKGHEVLESSWTLISEATLVPAPLGTGTLIPQSAFKPVKMEAHELRAFYITLKSMNLRYSVAKGRVGQVALQDDNLQVNIGATMLEHPFSNYLFEPRVFNGIFYFEAPVDCAKLFQTTRVPLQYVVLPDNSMSEDELVTKFNTNLKATILTLMRTDPQLKRFQKSSELTLKDVTTSILKNSNEGAVADCQAISTKKCIAIESSLTFQHADELQTGQVTFQVLENRNNIANGLNMGNNQVVYAGGITVTSEFVLTVEGVPDNQPLNANQVAYFEKVTKAFLESKLKVSSANVLSVKVTQQLSRSKKHRDLRSSGSNLDLSTTITGEYRPPPFVDFDGVVSDSIDGGSSALADDLKTHREVPGFLKPGNAEYFANVQSVHSKPPDVTQAATSMSIVGGESTESNKSWISIPLLLFSLFLLCGYILYKKRSSRKKNLLDEQMGILLSEDTFDHNDKNLLTAEVVQASYPEQWAQGSRLVQRVI